MMSKLCERLREERKRLGLTQAELSAACGVGREMVGRYERGRVIPGGAVLAAFGRLGADLQYLLVGPGQYPPPAMHTRDEGSIRERLRQERNRLCISHARIAVICAVAKTSVIAWEKGAKIPAQALAELHKAGFDVLYIITGQTRCSPSARRELREFQGRLSAFISEEVVKLQRY